MHNQAQFNRVKINLSDFDLNRFVIYVSEPKTKLSLFTIRSIFEVSENQRLL